MPLLLVCAAGCASGCATGVTEGDGAGGSGGAITGVGGSTGGDLPDPTTTTSTTGGAGGDMGGMGGAGGESGGMGGAGGSCDFSHLNSCPGTVLASVRGDAGSDTDVEQGTASAWFNVEVWESLDNIFEDDLSYRVTLESPPGADYDLYVHESSQVHDGGSGPNCGVAASGVTINGATETVQHGYDDDQGIGGLDDTLWLAIEVRHVSGSDCSMPWILTVQGDP
jgi:hypothetical protein